MDYIYIAFICTDNRSYESGRDVPINVRGIIVYRDDLRSLNPNKEVTDAIVDGMLRYCILYIKNKYFDSEHIYL